MKELNVKHKTNKKARATKGSPLVQARNTDYLLEEESRTRLCLRLHPSETDPELAVRLTDDIQVVRYKTTPETGINIRQLARSIAWFISGEIDQDESKMSTKSEDKTDDVQKKEENPGSSSIGTKTVEVSTSGKNKKKKKNKK